jgi:hypothetical protein
MIGSTRVIGRGGGLGMETLVRRSPVRVATGVIALAALAVVWLFPRGATAQGDVHVFLPAAQRSVFLDFGRDGLRLGDRLATRGPVLDAMGGSKVGTGHGDCVVARAITDGPEGPGGVYRCSYVLDLADGDLIVEGLDPHGPGVYTFAVMGGTEDYSGARGDVTLTEGFDGTDVVIDLI